MSQITAFSSTTDKLFHSLEVFFLNWYSFYILAFSLFLPLARFTQPAFILLLLSDPWHLYLLKICGFFIMCWFSSCTTHCTHLIHLLFFLLKSIPSDSDLFYCFPLNSVLPLFFWSVQNWVQEHMLSSTWAIAKTVFLLSCVILKNKRCTWHVFLSA